MSLTKTTSSSSFVIKRGKHFYLEFFFKIILDGRHENVFLDKIVSRINKLCYNLNMDYVDPVSLF